MPSDIERMLGEIEINIKNENWGTPFPVSWIGGRLAGGLFCIWMLFQG